VISPVGPPEGAMIEAVKQAEAELVSEEELTDQENDVTEAAPEEKPAIIKMKKKSLRKKKEAKVAAVDEGNEQEVPLATTSEPVVDDTYLHKQISVITDRMGYVSKALTEIKQKTYERNDELKKRVDKLESKIDQLANAVLFVVNTVCLDDAVVSALKDIPQPKDY